MPVMGCAHGSRDIEMAAELSSRRRQQRVCLNRNAASPRFRVMRQGRFARLRAFLLLVALGLGLAGQSAVAFAMPMAHEDGPGLTVPMGGSDGCPGCDSQPLTLSCGVGFCSASPAILAQGPAIKPTLQAIFPLVTTERVEGITVRPDLGPPRPTRHA